MFSLDQQLLDEAKERLTGRNNIYWLVGSSCSGKSTLTKAISEHHDIFLYDMDAHIYGQYMPDYSDSRHPANKEWLSAPNPFGWQLDLSIEDFKDFTKVTNAEYLDLFAKDIVDNFSGKALLVDGGLTFVSLLAQVIVPEHIICLEISPKHRQEIWKTSEERAEIKDWISALPETMGKWEKFMELDEVIAETVLTETKAHDIEILFRDEKISIDSLVQTVIQHFKL